MSTRLCSGATKGFGGLFYDAGESPCGSHARGLVAVERASNGCGNAAWHLQEDAWQGCDIPRSCFYRQGPWILPPFFWNHKLRVSECVDRERPCALGRRAQQVEVAAARLARCNGHRSFNMVLTLRKPTSLLERRRQVKHVRQ